MGCRIRVVIRRLQPELARAASHEGGQRLHHPETAFPRRVRHRVVVSPEGVQEVQVLEPGVHEDDDADRALLGDPLQVVEPAGEVRPRVGVVEVVLVELSDVGILRGPEGCPK